PVSRSLGLPTQPLELAARPADDIEIDPLQGRTQLRLVEVAVVVLCPPICPGAMLPVARKRRTQAIAVLIPTPNCDAAARRDRPPSSTAATTRSRRSTE